MEKISWSAFEYEEKERSVDWFWALGVIVVASSIASILYGNYFFAGLLIIGGILLGFFAIRKPETVNYELNSRGFKIRDILFPYQNIKSFWVQVDRHGDTPNIKPTLFIKSERFFMPIISVPIEENLAEQIHNCFISNDIKEEEMKEHPSHHVMESLGF